MDVRVRAVPPVTAPRRDSRGLPAPGQTWPWALVDVAGQRGRGPIRQRQWLAHCRVQHVSGVFLKINKMAENMLNFENP